MERRVLVVSLEEASDVIKALNVPIRRRMLELLRNNTLNVNGIAEALDIPQSTCVMNVQALEKAGLLRTEQVSAAKGAQKMCSVACEEIVISLMNETEKLGDRILETEMPIGLYTDFEVTSPCGMLSNEGIIGYYDQESSFLHPHRAAAALIWFTKGHLSYRFPLNFTNRASVLSVSVVMELCSEFPGFRNAWPSDITLWINDAEVGTWTSPGDMGGKRGRFTPDWWDVSNSQYGFLKSWKVAKDGSYIDGVRVSATTLADIAVDTCDSFLVRVGNKANAENPGGVNLFGRGFGNYERGIVLKTELQ
jgi:predicted transcriptional regulator